MECRHCQSGDKSRCDCGERSATEPILPEREFSFRSNLDPDMEKTEQVIPRARTGSHDLAPSGQPESGFEQQTQTSDTAKAPAADRHRRRHKKRVTKAPSVESLRLRTGLPLRLLYGTGKEPLPRPERAGISDFKAPPVEKTTSEARQMDAEFGHTADIFGNRGEKVVALTLRQRFSVDRAPRGEPNRAQGLPLDAIPEENRWAPLPSCGRRGQLPNLDEVREKIEQREQQVLGRQASQRPQEEPHPGQIATAKPSRRPPKTVPQAARKSDANAQPTREPETKKARPKREAKSRRFPISDPIRIQVQGDFIIAPKDGESVDFGSFVAELARECNRRADPKRAQMNPSLRGWANGEDNCFICVGWTFFTLDCRSDLPVSVRNPRRIRLVSPTFKPLVTPGWRREIELTWIFLNQYCIFEADSSCNTTINVIPPGNHFTSTETRRFAQAVVHFETATEQLIPGWGASGLRKKRNWRDNPKLGGGGLTQAQAISALENPADNGIVNRRKHIVQLIQESENEEYLWNFQPLLWLHRPLVQFQKPPCWNDPNELFSWIEFTMFFTEAAMACPSSVELQKFARSAGGLRHFVEPFTEGREAHAEKLWKLWQPKRFPRLAEALANRRKPQYDA